MSYPYNNNYGYQQYPPQQNNYISPNPPYPIPQQQQQQQPLYPVLPQPNTYTPPTSYHPQYPPNNSNYGYSQTSHNVASYLVNSYNSTVDPLAQPYHNPQINSYQAQNSVIPPRNSESLPPYASFPSNPSPIPTKSPYSPYASNPTPSLPPQNPSFYAAPYPNEPPPAYSPEVNTPSTSAPSAPPLNASGSLSLSQNSMRTSISEEENNLHSQFGDYVISYAKLSLGKEIGRGAFGVVYKGRYRATDVAIKQLLKNESIELQEFLAEAQVMKRLPSHPNVVLFRGITVPPDPITLVTDFCDGGSLLGLLSSDAIISLEDKLRFITEIAAGMEHLHTSIKGQQVIHRDLAARNILLKSGHAMVSDFGMVCCLCTGIHPAGASQEARIRITPNEARCWATEVVIVEIITRQPPWPDHDPVQAAFEVVKGARTPMPSDMPADLKKLVEVCWAEDANSRPEFAEISDMMNEIYEAELVRSDARLVSNSIAPTYASVPGQNSIH